jgi:hypothetical protein
MTHKFFTTNNAAWYPRNSPTGKLGSERMVLYQTIAQRPGITSQEIKDSWPFSSSVTSRLKELADNHYIEQRKSEDLFALASEKIENERTKT